MATTTRSCRSVPRLSSKIVKRATLKIYKGAPLGMCSPLKDRLNAELLAFIQQEKKQRLNTRPSHRELHHVIVWSNEAGELPQRSTDSMSVCTHLKQIRKVKPSAQGCEECLKSGDEWVHLRLCMTCGHVGCCDSSKNKHATKHFRATTHPIVRSLEPGEDWMWCYVDEVMME